jgi:hypothetical protein
MTLTWSAPLSEDPAGIYAWGGYRVASNMRLARLHESAGLSDLVFTWRLAPATGHLPELSAERRIEARGRVLDVAMGREGDLIRYDVGHMGTFLVDGAQSSIDLYAERDVDPSWVEHVLVNAALPLMAEARGVLSLHAAAAVRDGRAWIIGGPSGVGKSTAALGLIRKGWELLGDDRAVVREKGDGWLVYPVSRTIRLLDTAGAGRVKREVLAPATPHPAVLDRILLLVPGEAGTTVEPRSVIFRSLFDLGVAWPWAERGARGSLAEAAWRLMERSSVLVWGRGDVEREFGAY